MVISKYWNNGSVTRAGAVTWGNGTARISGVVSISNSLVGSAANDQVGNGGITDLGNGNYLVQSPDWTNGSVNSAGAVSWGNGTMGLVGAVSASNSLVGSTSLDQLGKSDITALSNGNYVVVSPDWDNGSLTNAGQ